MAFERCPRYVAKRSIQCQLGSCDLLTFFLSFSCSLVFRASLPPFFPLFFLFFFSAILSISFLFLSEWRRLVPVESLLITTLVEVVAAVERPADVTLARTTTRKRSSLKTWPMASTSKTYRASFPILRYAWEEWTSFLLSALVEEHDLCRVRFPCRGGTEIVRPKSFCCASLRVSFACDRIKCTPSRLLHDIPLLRLLRRFACLRSPMVRTRDSPSSNSPLPPK